MFADIIYLLFTRFNYYSSICKTRYYYASVDILGKCAALVTTFNLEIGITGAILTKLDGDSRGGAALSVKEVSLCYLVTSDGFCLMNNSTNKSSCTC